MYNINRKKIFSNKLNVRIDDINYSNHLCHTKIVNIIHNTRALFLKSIGLSEINCFGLGLIMLNLNIDYLSECFFPEEFKELVNSITSSK
jgi:acyl-CoA thioesterase FadM